MDAQGVVDANTPSLVRARQGHLSRVVIANTCLYAFIYVNSVCLCHSPVSLVFSTLEVVREEVSHTLCRR